MDLGTAVTGAWSSGISMYLVAAVFGLAGRFETITTPEWLQEPWVIAGAGGLFIVEGIVDKVSWLDSGWDAVHTVLRPMAGAAIFSGVGDETTVGTVAAGGGLALSAHLGKAALRAVINTSPEPASNILVSLAEDGLVAGLMALALTYPVIALAITSVLVVISVVVAVVVATLLRKALHRFAERHRARRMARGAPG